MKACFFCYKKKKKVVVFKFEVFDESIKQLAKKIAGEFPGVTKVVEVEGRSQLGVRGKFSISELTKKLKKIDESVEAIKIVPGGVTEPEVKIKKQDKGKRLLNIQKAGEPRNYGASSSNWTGSKKQRLLEKAKGEEAKVFGFVAAEKAIGLGVGEVQLFPNNREEYYGNMNNGQDIWPKAPQALTEEEMKQKKIRQEKEKEKRRQQALVQEVKNKRKIRQEEEEEKRRKQALAEEEKKQKKIRQEKEDEKRRKQALENNSGGTTQGSMVTGISRSLWSGISTLTSASAQALGTGQSSTSAQTQRTGQPSTCTSTTQTQRNGQSSTSATQTQRTSTSTRQTQRTGEPSTSTQYPFQHKQKTRPDEKKGKRG